jgi:hypothetical protein
VIFAAGIATGRWTAPKPRILVTGVGGRINTSDDALARLTARLDLDSEQQQRLAPLLEEMAGELALHAPASPERLDTFRRLFPPMGSLLRPDQKPAFDRYIRESEARMKRMIRIRDRRIRATNSTAGLPPPNIDR